MRVLAPYLAAFPQSKLNEASLMVYASALEGFNLAELDAALLKLLRTARFFPTVAEIIATVETIHRHAAGQALPTPDEAWQEAMGLVRKCHVYKPWRFSCPAVEMAVKRFGKMELCYLEASAVNTARAQFMRIYESVVRGQADKQHNEAVLASLPAPVREKLGWLSNTPPPASPLRLRQKDV